MMYHNTYITLRMHSFFDYRCYKKKSKYICLRSANEERHFTLLYVNPKDALSLSEWQKINERVQQYLENHNWKLNFTPIKACENCTYGHFDEEFEDLILEIRKEYSCINNNHDLSPSTQHAHLANEHCKFPIFAHISHSRGTNTELTEFLQKAHRNTSLTLDIRLREENND